MEKWIHVKKNVILPHYYIVLMLLIIIGLSGSPLAHSDEFKLGAGDEIKVDVFDQPELAILSRIGLTGRVVMPLVGAIKVDGLTTNQVEAKIAKLLSDGGYVKRPQVVVTIVNVHSQQVSVLGHVVKPGKYPLEGPTTLIDLLATAGGLGVDSAEVLLIIREENGKKQTIRVDTGDFFSGQVSSNIELRTGDLILVPKMDIFYIYGEVSRPGAYRLERGMSVVQALSVGGGLTARGTQKGIHIKRKIAEGNTKEFTADLNDMIKPNDVVYVKESFF